MGGVQNRQQAVTGCRTGWARQWQWLRLQVRRWASQGPSELTNSLSSLSCRYSRRGDRKRASDWCFPGDQLPYLLELVRRRARSRLVRGRDARGALRLGWRGGRPPRFAELTCSHPAAAGRLRTTPGCVVQASPPLSGGLRAYIRDVECDLLVPWQVTRDLALPVPLQDAFT